MMNGYPRVLRIVAPVALAALLLAGGLAVLSQLAARGDEGAMMWFWPVAGATFFLLAWLIQKRLGRWLSPDVFLMASVPVLVLLLSAHVLLPYVQGPLGPPPEELTAGEKADLSGDFLLTVQGRKVSLADYQGRLTFINFWATWCGPCRAEMPSMGRLYDELKDEGLTMAAITDEDPETVRAYLERYPYSFPILIDPRGKLSNRFRVFALPTTVVLDAEGRILLEHQGAYQWDSPEIKDKFRRQLVP